MKSSSDPSLTTTSALYQTQPEVADPTNRAISVASVTVSFNGAHIIERQLRALKRQSHRISEIIVVNNASTDGLPQLLAAKFPEVTVLNLKENGGVGGALSAGLDYAALKKKYDWVWLFDDDSLPADNALEMLLASLDHINGEANRLAILAPLWEDESTQMPVSGVFWQRGRIVTAPIKLNQPITLVDLVISSGTLIRREAIESVGLPRADFFMDFVDFEYCLRLRRNGYKIGLVRDSHFDHTVGEPTGNRLARIMGWTDHAPWRRYYITRNEVYTIWQYYGTWRSKTFFLCRSLWVATILVLFGKQKLACFRMMWRGFLDGRAGRLGISVPNSSS
jgi:rhamnosyltransferase